MDICISEKERIKMTNEEALNVINSLIGQFTRLEQPTAVEGLNGAKRSLEKQIPKPLEWKLMFDRISNQCTDGPHCPVCGNNYNGTLAYGCDYCDICGQRLDWGK